MIGIKGTILISMIVIIGASAALRGSDCSISNCQVCDNAQQCVQCESGFQLTINKDQSSSICVRNFCDVPHCALCANDGTCVECESAFLLQNNGRCSFSNQFEEGCARRMDNGDCAACAIGFILIDGNCEQGLGLQMASTSCSVSNCQICNNPNFCNLCKTNFQPTIAGKCLSVTTAISNCQYYTTSAVLSGPDCFQCVAGYSLTTNDTCVLCSTPFCSKCSNTNFCSACISSSYTLSNGTCGVTNCFTPCETCAVNGQCTKCKSPYNQNPDPDGKCYFCSTPGCSSCGTQDTDTCTACFSPYHLFNEACVYPCDSDLCKTCTITNTTHPSENTCTSCVNGYTVVSNTCQKCYQAPLCKSCETNLQTCSSCIQGYYIDSGICQQCAAGCASCTGPDITQCSSFLNGESYTISSKLQTKPVACDYGCAACSLTVYPGACTTCFPGFYWSQFSCYPCNSNCLTCNPANSNQCYSCRSNGYFNDTTNTCSYCNSESNCLTCQENNLAYCTSCPYGYALNSSTVKCNVICPQGCTTCFAGGNPNINNGLNCTDCISGYTLNSLGECLPCLANCRVCSGQYPNICLQCGDGYYSDHDYTCVPCQENCESCSAVGCFGCSSGFYLASQDNKTSICIPQCSYPCATCTFSSRSTCTSCYYGYTLSDNTCKADGCTPTSTTTCQLCAFGLSLDQNNKCIACTASNCARCQTKNTNYCINCFSGYYSNNGNCDSCAANCSTCVGPNTCISCSYGHTSATQSISLTQVICLQCQSPCQTCTVNQYQCTSCISGFTLNGWICVSNFHYIISMTFQTSNLQFFANYQTFLNATAAAMQTSSYKVISIVSVEQDVALNNVTVKFNVSTFLKSSDDSAYTQFENVEYTYDQSYFANMQLLAYSVQSSESITLPNTSPSFYAGLLVPLLITVFIFACYCYCSRTDRDLPGQNYNKIDEPQKGSAKPIEERQMKEL